METFKRNPTIRMLAAEVRDIMVELQSGGDQYTPKIYLSPTGAEVNRVLIAGTAVEKEDVGTDNSFWRVRVVDPTGALFVYAGQYQPEAAKVIQKFEVPCFVIISGKIAHYTPESGGDTIVSVRAESIASVRIESRDFALADIANHTIKRLLEARNNLNVQENYPNYDYNTFVQSISTLLDQILEETIPAVNDTPVAPQTEQASLQVPPSPVEIHATDTQTPKPATELPIVPPVKAPDAPEKQKGNRKKEGGKKFSLDGTIRDAPKEPVKETPKETQKETPKTESKTVRIQDSDCFVLDILKTHRQEPGIPKGTIQNVLKGLGYAILDVDGILKKLKTDGEIIEPKNGFFKAV